MILDLYFWRIPNQNFDINNYAFILCINQGYPYVLDKYCIHAGWVLSIDELIILIFYKIKELIFFSVRYRTVDRQLRTAFSEVKSIIYSVYWELNPESRY